MKILILNWRDPKSPLEGGAERFTKKYGEFWSSQGHQVTWITNSFPGAKSVEEINGINFIRVSPSLDGTLFKYILNYPIFLIKTIFLAHGYIKKHEVDVVIDEIHGLPFFTPLFSRARNVLLTCEVAGPIWDKMFPFPINKVGQALEKLIYQIYKDTEVWAISENTKKNILDLLPDKEIKIIDLGVDENKEILKKIKDVKKTPYPSAIFLARLVKMKGIETAIEATAEIVKIFPDFKLFVVGDGGDHYKEHLLKIALKLNVRNSISFLGKTTELKKYIHLKKAHFLLHPSYKEGFGLTVLEAGLVGTPALIRRGSSLDELVVEGKNGYKFDNESQIPLIVKKILSKDYSNLQKNSTIFSLNRTWPRLFTKSRIIV